MKKQVWFTLFCVLASPAFGVTLSDGYSNLLSCLDGLNVGKKGTSMISSPIARIGNNIFVGGKLKDKQGLYVYGPNESYFFEMPDRTALSAPAAADKPPTNYDKVHVMRISVPGQKSFIVKLKPSFREGTESTVEAIDEASADPSLAQNAITPGSFSLVGHDITDLKSPVSDKAVRDQLSMAMGMRLFTLSDEYSYSKAGINMAEKVSKRQVFSAGQACGPVTFPYMQSTIKHVFNAMNYYPAVVIDTQAEAGGGDTPTSLNGH